jgi:hypothetical protein
MMSQKHVHLHLPALLLAILWQSQQAAPVAAAATAALLSGDLMHSRGLCVLQRVLAVPGRSWKLSSSAWCDSQQHYMMLAASIMVCTSAFGDALLDFT